MGALANLLLFLRNKFPENIVVLYRTIQIFLCLPITCPTSFFQKNRRHQFQKLIIK